MKKNGNNKSLTDQISDSDEKNKIQEYPFYPAREDIYSKYKEEKDINPEDVSNVKDSGANNKSRIRSENDFDDDESGSDLDVPGSELDDEQEFVGSEDEENNYYSLGSDDHNDLDEDNTDVI